MGNAIALGLLSLANLSFALLFNSKGRKKQALFNLFAAGVCGYVAVVVVLR